MKSYCDYHPLKPARWLCNECQVYFCKTCTPDVHPNCPTCLKRLEDLGSSNEVAPFWDRLPEFFKYPLLGQSIILMLLSAFFAAFIKEDVSGLLIIIAVFALQTLYGFTVLKATADGELKPPVLFRMFSGNTQTLLKSIFWVIGIAVLSCSGFFVSLPLGIMTLLFGLFVYPASAILLVHEASLRAALNPLRVMDFIGRTFMGYIILYIHLVIILAASGAAEASLAAETAGKPLNQGLVGFISTFFYIMSFNMLGYFLLQYQRELGFTAILNDELLDEEPVESDPLYRAKLWVKMGDYHNAVSALDTLRKAHPQNEHIKHYYWELLLQIQDFEKLAMHVDPICIRYMSMQKLDDLLPFLQFMLQERPNGFNELETKMKLATAFIEQENPKIAVALLKTAHQQFEFDPKRLDAILMLADALGQLSQKSQVEKVLKFALTLANRDQKLRIQQRIAALS